MASVGIVGGLGVGATVHYYEKITAACKARGVCPISPSSTPMSTRDRASCARAGSTRWPTISRASSSGWAAPVRKRRCCRR